jgi:hypothetical protein
MCVSCEGRAELEDDEEEGSCRDEEARVAEEGRLSGEAEAKGEGEGAMISAHLMAYAAGLLCSVYEYRWQYVMC